MSLKLKIYSIVILMLLVIVTTNFVLISRSYKDWNTAESMGDLANTQIEISKLIHETQKERGKTAQYMNKVISISELEEQRKKVDELINQVTVNISKSNFKEKKHVIEVILQNMKDIHASIDANGELPLVLKKFTEHIHFLIVTEVDLFSEINFEGLESGFSSLAIFENAKESMGQMRAKLNGIFSSNKAVTINELDQLGSLKSGILINLESPGLVISSEGRTDTMTILNSKDWGDILKMYEVVVSKYSTGNYEIDSKVFFKLISDQIDSVFKIIQSEQEKNVKELNAQKINAKNSFIFISLVSFAVILISIISSFLVMKKIINSLTSIANSLTNEAETITESAETAQKSGQVLSECTSELAASIQETAASLTEVSSMINRSSENANVSLSISSKTLTTTKDGQDAINTLSKSIDAIKNSNLEFTNQVNETNIKLNEIVGFIHEISNKTKVINDIVFQTKLLSFNASVEAARAGENGKGFSVVAEEVGNLAKMSGDSASEISALLQDSVSKVENISKENKIKADKMSAENTKIIDESISNVKKTIDIFNNISSFVNDVNTQVVEISNASDEQSKGVAEINSAVTQLDKISLVNSKSSEDSFIFSQHLSQQAQRLQSEVFELKNTIFGKKQ